MKADDEDQSGPEDSLPFLTLYLRTEAARYSSISISDVEDAVSDALLHYWRLASSEDEQHRQAAHLISTNEAFRRKWSRYRFFNHIRKAVRKVSFEFKSDLPELNIPDESSEKELQEVILISWISTLKEKVSEIPGADVALVFEIVLHSALSGESERDLASKADIPLNVYYKRKQRLLERLRRYLSESSLS